MGIIVKEPGLLPTISTDSEALTIKFAALPLLTGLVSVPTLTGNGKVDPGSWIMVNRQVFRVKFPASPVGLTLSLSELAFVERLLLRSTTSSVSLTSISPPRPSPNVLAVIKESSRVIDLAVRVIPFVMLFGVPAPKIVFAKTIPLSERVPLLVSVIFPGVAPLEVILPLMSNLSAVRLRLPAAVSEMCPA